MALQANQHFKTYSDELIKQLSNVSWNQVESLAEQIVSTHFNGGTVYLAGNGGSAANALHFANDLLYGSGLGLKVEALSANVAVITCLANDEGYEHIYSAQLKTKGTSDDLLIVFSGSGNSENIINAIETATSLGMKTVAVLGFNGGVCKTLADTVLHVPVDDMQIAEDFQMIYGHMITQWIAKTYSKSTASCNSPIALIRSQVQ